MAGNLQPLDEKFAIVDDQGRPTLYFIKWAQQKQIDIQASITSDQFNTLLLEYLLAHQLQEGDGIALTPSGNLDDSPEISVRNGTGLNFDGMQNLKIADTAVTPGTYGDATHVGQFTVDQQGRITAAADVAISGGGGGGNNLRPALQISGNYLPADTINYNTGTVVASNNLITFMPFSRDVDIDAIVVHVTTATAAGNSVRGALYSAHPTTGLPDALIEEGAAQATNSTGIKAITLAADYPITEMLWLAVLFQVNTTCRNNTTNEENAHILSHASVTGPANNRYNAAFAYAAFPADTSALTLAADTTTLFVGARLA